MHYDDTKSLLKFRLHTNHSTVLYLSVQAHFSQVFHFLGVFKLFVYVSIEHVLATARDVLSWRRFNLGTLKRGNIFEAYSLTKLRNFTSKKGNNLYFDAKIN